jgi:NAD(P)-dependent dehydrogenase (short-subunit alcohol dehydrogenase family)
MSKVWFITGAGSGIGTGIAKAALRAGDRVVATGRNINKVRNALGDLASENLAFVQLDVVDEAQASAAIEKAVQRFGRIDVAVNNAGYSLLGNFEEMTISELQSQLATNFYGVAYVMRAVLPAMRKQRSGHIINISSMAGVIGFKHCAAYAASKFAVEGLSLSVAAEVERFGIKLTLVEPGFFRTDLLNDSNVRWPGKVIEDYASEAKPKDVWSAYDGTQQGDPDKLGEALVKIAGMTHPPKQFYAGSDAVSLIEQTLKARLQEIKDFEELSRSTDGNFQHPRKNTGT